MGPSGSGKTTLLNCISCYIPSDSGSILLGNTELAKLDEEALADVRNKKLGFVFQDFLLLDGLSVRENILLPSIIGASLNDQVEARADQLCEVFGLSHIRDKYPAEISGGEKQRTAVARALINQPLMILADEPTGNLDSKSSRAVIDSFLQARQAMDATILMVTHSMDEVAQLADRMLVLNEGTIEMSGTPREVFSHAARLAEIGLSVPQVTALFLRLRELGVDVDPTTFTVEQAVPQLRALLEGRAHA